MEDRIRSDRIQAGLGCLISYSKGREGMEGTKGKQRTWDRV